VTIPSSVNSYLVTGIGTNAFYNKTNITVMVVPDSVTSIGNSAFFGCSGMTNLTLPSSLSDLGASVFFGCSGLKNISIPNGITNIGNALLYGCSSLTNVVIPDGVNLIDDWALGSCSALQCVTLPNSVTNIGVYVFYACPSITNIAVSSANPAYISAGGVLFNKAMTTLVQYPGGLTGSYAIPDSVTSIGDWAFGYSFGLTSVTIPGSVTNMGNYTFAQSVITNVTIGNGVTSIGNWSFDYCSGLKYVVIPNTVTSIGNSAFQACYNLTAVTIPAGVTNIGTYAFEYCYALLDAYFLGNAPSVNGAAGSMDSTVFYTDSGTVYYVPGTTGWGATFGGWPTAGWYQPQPQILGTGYGPGVHGNGFQFTISWATNTAVVVEASTNLQNWMPAITNTLVSGTNAFIDSTWTNYPQRFYRVRAQ
jgi:hypothetical protein